MRYSRTGIIAVLLAAEVFVGGAIIYSLNSGSGFRVSAAGLHHASEGGKTFEPVDAGAAPHIVIDDPNSHVVIDTSTDGKVHVTDASRISGWIWGDASRPPLKVARTADGVSISRAGDGRVHIEVFGFSSERVEVSVPPASLLDVRRCSAADVTGLTGEIRVHSVDGHIAANDVRTHALTLASDDGRLLLDNVSADTIDATTKDGSIHASGLQTGGGTLETSDGSISLGLAPNVNLQVQASTNDGRLTFDGRRAPRNDSDASSAQYQVGTGGGSLSVATQDGSIHILTNGAQ